MYNYAFKKSKTLLSIKLCQKIMNIILQLNYKYSLRLLYIIRNTLSAKISNLWSFLDFPTCLLLHFSTDRGTE